MKKLFSRISNIVENNKPINADRAGLKLNLGCGNDYRPGYLNVDFNDSHKVDLISDVMNLSKIKDLSCVEVLAQDVLEHIQRCRCLTALKEWNRVLKINGILKIRVPSVIDLVNLLSLKNNESVESQINLIKCLFGTQGYVGDFHYNGFTKTLLEFYLHESGFKLNSIKIFDGWMFDVVAEKTTHMQPDPILLVDSDHEFIEKIYVYLLSRSADTEGILHYLKILSSGISREAVIESLKDSDEYKNKNKNKNNFF